MDVQERQRRQKRLERLFLPQLPAQIGDLSRFPAFAYYTSAEVAFSIMNSRELWMRQTRVMNDRSEATHGFEGLKLGLQTDDGKRLIDWASSRYPSAVRSLFGRGSTTEIALNDAFLLCLSEHAGVVAEEAHMGRLSMWRAYGGRAGVALLFDRDLLMSESARPQTIFSVKVRYETVAELAERVNCWARSILEEIEVFEGYDDEIGAWIWFDRAFKSFVLGTKHPGFREEREWRLVHLSGPTGERYALEYETVNGLPQPVIKLKLGDQRLSDSDPPSFDQVFKGAIIGPCDAPDAVAAALRSVSTKRQVPEVPIVISDIPLRWN